MIATSFVQFLLISLFLCLAPNLGSEPNPSQTSRPSNVPTACQARRHVVTYRIPDDSPLELTRAINKDGILTCVSAEPGTGFCHIELLEARVDKYLRVKDSMGSGKTDTFTFKCGPDTKSCAVVQCD
jgi:hypothetical protein